MPRPFGDTLAADPRSPDDVWVGRHRGQIRLKYRSGRVEHVDPEEFVGRACLPSTSAAFVRLYQGATVINRLAALATAGTIRGVTVVGDIEIFSTRLGPVDRATARAWAEGGLAALAFHPAAQLLPYAPAGDRRALCDVLGRVFDPRWYTDSDHPDRVSRLEACLGLEPRHDRRVDLARRGVLTSCWSDGRFDRPAVAADYFGRLARRLLADRSRAKVDRIVGRHFLKALRAAWLDGYTTVHIGRAPVEPMFDPPRLFDPIALDAVRGVG